MSIHEFIGLIGVFFIVISYFLIQVKIWNSSMVKYSIFNLLGSSMVLYSLIYDWNLAAFIIELIWIIVSLLGLFIDMRRKQIKK